MKFALALAATLLAAGATAAVAQEPIKIGYAISKTGSVCAGCPYADSRRTSCGRTR